MHESSVLKLSLYNVQIGHYSVPRTFLISFTTHKFPKSSVTWVKRGVKIKLQKGILESPLSDLGDSLGFSIINLRSYLLYYPFCTVNTICTIKNPLSQKFRIKRVDWKINFPILLLRVLQYKYIIEREQRICNFPDQVGFTNGNVQPKISRITVPNFPTPNRTSGMRNAHSCHVCRLDHVPPPLETDLIVLHLQTTKESQLVRILLQTSGIKVVALCDSPPTLGPRGWSSCPPGFGLLIARGEWQLGSAALIPRCHVGILVSVNKCCLFGDVPF